MIRAEYIIGEVIIDVQNATVTILDNGKSIPEQVHKFTDCDEWFDITDRHGNSAVFGNIWWDEQWGFQYVNYEPIEDRLQAGSDYTNPGFTFKDGDSTDIDELDWYKETIPNPDPRTELENEIVALASSIINDDRESGGILKAEDRVGLKRLVLKLSFPYRKEKR